MQKPKPEDYGYQLPSPWDEGGWCIEGGQEAFIEALEHYKAQIQRPTGHSTTPGLKWYTAEEEE